MNTLYTRIIRYLIDKPLLVNLSLIFIVLLSVVSIMGIQKVGLPRVDMYEIQIFTTYPGASPEDVELNVTRKIEEALEEISDISFYKSQSMENLSIIHIKIDSATEDIEKVKDSIRRSLSDISDFPDEIKENPKLFEQKSDNWPIYTIGIYHKNDDILKIQEGALELRRELLQLSSVAKVDKEGVPDKEIKILLNKEAMAREYISFSEIIQAIQANKIRLSAGSVESYTTEKGIVTFSEFRTPEEIGNIIIRSNDTGLFVKLGEVAHIEYGLEKLNTIHRINGQKGMWLNVIKQGNADIVESVENIEQIISKFQVLAETKGLVLQTMYDDSIETKIRMEILYQNAFAGLILILVALFLFFRKKLAIWSALGMPIAIGIAFIVAYMMDATLNRVSLLGLVVVLGMLVDDSIIIAENIYRREEEGEDSQTAAIGGAAAVFKPVIATVVTTIIAFLPMYFIPGEVMDFAREIPTFVIAMLLGSLLESLFILPAHIGHEKRGSGIKKEIPPGDAFLAGLERKYKGYLEKALQYKYISLGLLTLFLLIGGIMSAIFFRFVLFPIDQSYSLLVYGETKSDSSLDYTSGVIKKIEPFIGELKEKGIVVSYRTIIGKKGLYAGDILPNQFKISLVLTPATTRDMKALDVKNHIFDKIKENGSSGIEKLDYYIDGGGPPTGKPIEIQIIGNDNDKRREIIDTISKELAEIGISEVDNDYRIGKGELRLKPNYPLIAEAQLTVSAIATVNRMAFDGMEVAHLDTADTQIPFKVMLDKKYIDFNDPLEGLFVRNPLGIMVPIKKLVSVEKSQAAKTIFRYNGIRSNNISGNIDRSATAEEVYRKLKKKYQDFEKMYPGFKLILKGEAEKSSQMLINLVIGLVLAILAIYFFLTVQFNSFIQPVLVLLAIPFALIGIVLAFAVQGLDLSMLALIGIMGSSGVVINDSLIMVEFINRLRNEALNEEDSFFTSIINGAVVRLRPIFLTTITTVLGLIPTAYGFFGGYDSFISPMVMAMAWGLIVGTPMVLFIIPVVYLVMEDLKIKFASRFRL